MLKGAKIAREADKYAIHMESLASIFTNPFHLLDYIFYINCS